MLEVLVLAHPNEVCSMEHESRECISLNFTSLVTGLVHQKEEPQTTRVCEFHITGHLLCQTYGGGAANSLSRPLHGRLI